MNLRLTFLLMLTIGIGRAFAAEATAGLASSSTPASATATPARNGNRAASPAATPARSDSSVAPSATYDAFRLITDRNIFNPNRSGRRERATEERAPRTDVITFVGTMDYDKGVFAFFDGSDTSYRKPRQVGDSIEQYKVTKISAHAVELERDGKTTTMSLAQQLRRPEGGDWTLVGVDMARMEAQAQAKAADASKVDPTAPPAIPADADEVMKRLMERRAKQLKQ